MTLSGFEHAWFFLFLIAVFAIAVLYVLVQVARHKRMLRFANMELLESVAPKRPSRWRHLPAILLVLSLLMFTVAMAGPTHDVRIPRNRAVVMLVIDVSQSMRATDVSPNRLAAAQEAAKQFADQLTPGINLGLIAYAGTATVLVSPTTNREASKNAIDKLQLADRTATGEGIFTALQAIATVGAVIGGGDEPPPARIVLMSDGKETVPSNPDNPKGAYTAARTSKDQGVPISTVSFGTPYGYVEINDQRQPVGRHVRGLHGLRHIDDEHHHRAVARNLDIVRGAGHRDREQHERQHQQDGRYVPPARWPFGRNAFQQFGVGKALHPLPPRRLHREVQPDQPQHGNEEQEEPRVVETRQRHRSEQR